ncbi:MAG: hypothetical protein R2694_16495 [Ilumatobacteraceae bacterium]
MTEPASAGGRPSGPSRPWRALNRAFAGRRRLGVGALLGPPLAWMLVVYVGSLLLLVWSSLYKLDPVTQKPTHEFTWANLQSAFALWDADTRQAIWPFVRTVGVALLVTGLCVLIALPVAFFVAKVAPAGCAAA